MQKKSRERQSIFRFKQFEVDQTGCAMKINTDGVLLGAMAGDHLSGEEQKLTPEQRLRFLDIGAGTGVIALMLAQRFLRAEVEALEIDKQAAEQARQNFQGSPFADRLKAYHVALQDFLPADLPEILESSHGIYDLIVSNPPFFLDSLKNPDPRKELARHTDWDFFDHLLRLSTQWLAPEGCLQLILPPELSTVIEKKAISHYGLHPTKRTEIYSFTDDNRPIRTLLTLCRKPESGQAPGSFKFVIYTRQNEYSTAYRKLLKDFFLAF